MKHQLLVIFLCLSWLIIGCQNHQDINGINAQLKRVVSAQTIEVVIDNKEYQFRFMGIDTPSIKQKPWGKEAKEFLWNLVTIKGKNSLNSTTIVLETNLDVKDKFNRLSGYGWYNHELINQKIIAEGFGMVNLTYTDGKYDQQLLQAQNYARIMEKGIWNPQKPLRNLN